MTHVDLDQDWALWPVAAVRGAGMPFDWLSGLSDETRVVVSEPLGDLEGAWNEVPESYVGIIQPGADELRPFSPLR